MAGTVTHFYFAIDVIKKVEKRKKIIYDKDFLSIFSQSLDPFNFYSILYPIKKGSAHRRDFAGIFHCNKTDDFFYNLINYIKENNLKDNKEVMTFLYGYITHYVLDSSMHPYVEYKCGRVKSSDKSTYKYNAKHHEMETFIDVYMLKKNNSNYKNFKAYDEFFKINKFSKELKSMMDSVFFNVFQYKDFSKDYLKSIKDMKFCFKHLRYDPLGYKKVFYKGFDVISTKRILNSKFLSYSYYPQEKDVIRLLNLEHKTWHYPYDISRKYNNSFDELYRKAMDKCVSLIIEVINYIEKNKELDINSLFNLSYCTGLPWTLQEKSPIYEF